MPLSIVFTNPGNYTIEDDGIRGNNTSVIRDSSGVIVTTFVHPSDTLAFSTITPGVHLTFNVGDSFGSANVTVGALGDLAASPDSIVVRQMRTDAFMTLVSRTTITEGGSDASADLTAAAIVFSATNGIGTAANALELQTTFLEAETSNGDINLANFGLVQIGGITPDVDGLDVVSNGNLNFSTVGSIFLSDTSGPSTVHGGDISGNVTLTAIGEDADIYAPINYPSIYAPGGGITLNAGRNVWFGPGGMNFNNDVWATGDIRITAGGDFLLDGTSDVRTGAFGGVVGGDIVITAGRNINLDNTTGGLQTIQAFAGDVVLTTGAGAGAFAGGAFIENAAFPGAINSTENIILNSDTVLIASGGFNTTGIGSVTIRPVTPGLQIDLGNTGVDSPGAIGLSDAEFDLLFTLNVIIGNAVTGSVTFSAPLSPFIVDNLTVHSGNDIFFNSSLSLPGALTLQAGDDVYFSSTSSFTSANGGLSAFVDNAQDDGGSGGFGNLGGTLTVATSIQLIGNLDRDTLNGSAANEFLFGLGDGDTLRGFGGTDTLDGGAGSDTMSGGLGDDTFYVDVAGDIVLEAVGEGSDTVITNVSYALDGGQEVETLRTFGSGTTGVINLSGNEFANALLGNAAVNVLDGKGGADTLRGFGGGDTYMVDHGGDNVIEAVGGGVDTVIASASFVLDAGQEVETLRTLGSATVDVIDLTGNEFAQTIFGNAAVNVLDGKGGIDTLRGFGGNDTYFVDNGADSVIEAAGGGLDTVIATVHYTLGAGQEIELLRTLGSGTTYSVKLTGNELADTILGNAAVNVLDGKGGADSLRGFSGNDSFAFTSALGPGNVDTIVDFIHDDDTIVLDDAVFAGLALGALTAGAFRTGAAAADADDRIIYNGATGQLFFDPDGVGGAAQVQFATLTGAPAINASDFLVF